MSVHIPILPYFSLLCSVRCCPKLLFYEVPDYYYKGSDDTLEYYRLDVHENEGGVSGATHKVIFFPYEGEGMDFYDIEDK